MIIRVYATRGCGAAGGEQCVVPRASNGYATAVDGRVRNTRGGRGEEPRLAETYEHITLARARILRELAAGYSESQVAERLTLTYAGVHSQVQDLKEAVGCASVRQLGPWWMAHRELWLSHMADGAGCR